MNKSIKIWMFGFFMFCVCSLKAQIPGYVSGDENYVLTLAFHNVDTLLVVVPHNYDINDQEKTYIENYVFWGQYQKKPIYIYKRETELTKNDELKHLQFYGAFYDFKLPEIQKVPIGQVDGGFSFNNEVFDRPADSFFYLNEEATRLYTCRNSTKILHQYANLAAGYFPLYIFRGSELYLSGYCSHNLEKTRVNSIIKMRQAYFESVVTRYFDFELAKPLCSDSLKQLILGQADICLENLCAIIKTDTSDLERTTICVYNSMIDLQQFLSMSPRMTIYGKSIGSVNHLSEFDMTVFNHEMAHTVIGSKIGGQSNSFFCEGFAVYTGYFMNNNSYASDLDSTKNHLDLLTKEHIVGPDHWFYSMPPMYPISGVFTHFIIDKIGIDKFKAIYAQQNIENAFQEKGVPLEKLIAEFKTIIRTIDFKDE